MTLTPEEIQVRTLDGVALDAPLTSAEIENRKAEKAALLATQQEPAPEPAPELAAVAVDLATRLAEATRTSQEKTNYNARSQALAEQAAPVFTEARSLETAFGILRTRHAARAMALKGIDYSTLTKRVPPGHEFVEGAYGRRTLVPKNHRVIARMADAAARASILTSTIFDTHPRSARDVDAPDLRGTLDDLQGSIFSAAGPFWSEPRHRRLVSHAKHHLALARQTVGSAREAVERLVTAEKAMEQMLASVELLPLAWKIRER